MRDKAINPASLLKPKRARRTTAQVAQLDAQIMDVLRQDHPQSVRHVFYRMTNPRLMEPVDKSDNGYDQVQSRCVKLRRSGRLPYGWIADMSRQGYFTNVFADAADFVRSMAGHYRADLWRDADVRCEVWVESRSIASVLLRDCKDLAVSLYPCGGFTSLSFAHAAAQEHNGNSDKRPLVVLYIGDYDPAGVLIDVTLERELREHLRGDIALNFRRIGINEAHVKEYDLPTKPRKEGDKRSLQIAYTVEAEAMPAAELRAILRANVEALLPENALAVSRVAEQSEMQHLQHIANILEGGTA